MGIDLKKHHVRKSERKAPASTDAYVHSLHKIYSYLDRKTGSKFNSLVKRRLCHSRSNRQPISLSQLASQHKEDKTLVAVTKITNDERLEFVPRMTVAALKFSKSAEARILAAGGQVLRLDELATIKPTGSETILLRGKKSTRKVVKHFGAVCSKTKPAMPKTRSKGRKFEAKH